MAQDNWCSAYNKVLRSFDAFCATFYPGVLAFSQEMFNQWYKPLPGESRNVYLKRTNAMKDFISFVSATYTANIVIPKKENVDKRKYDSHMKAYASTGADLFNQFVCHRKTSGRWSMSYDMNLRSLDTHCATQYPNEPVLTQNMIDTWCEKRQSENLLSLSKRISVVNSFLKYTFKRGLLDIEWQSLPTHGKKKRIIKEPHAFTDVELKNFFFACDHIRITQNGLTYRLMKLIIPVFFRLLFSSGMRTNEVRNLDMEDVDLKHGIINIRHTKGYIEHRVALHPTMRKRLTEYDAAIHKIMPDRKCFFPNCGDDYYTLGWMDYNFELLWFKYNHHPATAYHLRHHYATTNINNWPAKSEKFNRNLLYLSRSMGHSSVETTMYYYNFTPKLAEILKERKTETFNEIIPERNQYFINYED
jgi:integrase